MNHEGSGACKSAGEEPQVGEEHPGGSAGDGGLEMSDCDYIDPIGAITNAIRRAEKRSVFRHGCAVRLRRNALRFSALRLLAFAPLALECFLFPASAQTMVSSG